MKISLFLSFINKSFKKNSYIYTNNSGLHEVYLWYICILYNQPNNYNVRLCFDMSCNRVNIQRNSLFQKNPTCKLKMKNFVNTDLCTRSANVGKTKLIISLQVLQYFPRYPSWQPAEQTPSMLLHTSLYIQYPLQRFSHPFP